MIGGTPTVRVWARAVPTNLRLGFNGLGAIVEQKFGHDLMGGPVSVRQPASKLSAHLVLGRHGDVSVYQEIVRSALCEAMATVWDGRQSAVVDSRVEPVPGGYDEASAAA